LSKSRELRKLVAILNLLTIDFAEKRCKIIRGVSKDITNIVKKLHRVL